MSDRSFLQWLEDRIVSVYGENRNVDFLHRLRAIKDSIPPTVPPTTGTKPPVSPLSQKIIDELQTERVRQRLKGYTDDQNDNTKDLDDWCDDIIAYATWAKQMARMGSPDKYRNRMKQIATMAAAACDSYDRTAPEGRWFGRDADTQANFQELKYPPEKLDTLAADYAAIGAKFLNQKTTEKTSEQKHMDALHILIDYIKDVRSCGTDPVMRRKAHDTLCQWDQKRSN